MSESIGHDGLMSQVDYARHRGVSKQAVGKMVRDGRIPTQLHAGRKMIDPAEADFALGASRSRVSSGPDEASGRTGPERDARTSSSGLTKARTDTETYRAKIAELEYNERVGRLIPLDDASRAMERCAEMMVRAIDQLPTRADDLATAFQRKGVAGLREALKGASRDLRETLSDHMRLAAAEDDEGAD